MDQCSTDPLMVHWSPLYPPLQYLTFIWHLSFIPSILLSNPHCPQLLPLNLLADVTWVCYIAKIQTYTLYTSIYTAQNHILFIILTYTAVYMCLMLVTIKSYSILMPCFESKLIVGGICFGAAFSASSLHHVGIADLFFLILVSCGLMACTETLSSARTFPQSRHWENKTWQIQDLSSNQLLRFHLHMHQHNASGRL